MAAKQAKFFESLRDHSEIKLRIVAKFIKPWSAKLGYKVRARGDKRIWYVDGFAGPGRYKDGAEGSPIRGAIRALEVLKEHRRYTLGCVNVELKAKRYAELEENTRGFRETGVSLHNLQGAFSQQIPEIMRIVDPSAPLLIFIDPFGISPLDFEALKPLLRRHGETDLILTFQTRAVYRLATDHPHYVSRAVGSAGWLPKWPAEKVDSVLQVLSENLLREGRFRAVAQYGIRGDTGRAVKYHLFMASRSYHAFELLNDFVCEEEEALDLKSYKAAAQATFLPEIDVQLEEHALVKAILDIGTTHKRTTRRAIREHLVLNTWARWHTREINNAVRALIHADRLKRLTKHRIDTDPLKFG